MRQWILFSLIIVGSVNARSQQRNKQNNWHVTAAATLLNGNTRTGAAITGKIEFQWNQRWALGMGSGFDHYFFRSVPVFAELQRYVGKEGKGLFVYGATGLNVPWPTDEQRGYRQNWGWGSSAQPSEFNTGLWSDLGIGYAFNNKKGHGMFLRAGHSLKTMDQKYSEQVWNGTSAVTALREINYMFGRVSIQAGFRF